MRSIAPIALVVGTLLGNSPAQGGEEYPKMDPIVPIFAEIEEHGASGFIFGSGCRLAC